jgi:hypothetical protein
MRVIPLTSVLMVLFSGLGAMAQSATGNPNSVLARLSYHTGSQGIDWRNEKESPHICMAVYHSGYYQISRLTEHGNQTLQGTMPQDQLAQLQTLLHEVDFQSVGGGIQYLQGAESLVIEVLNHGKSKHIFWVNPDDRNPLPKSAIRVVDWLEDFQAHGATSFNHYEDSDMRICPSMNDNPMPLTSSLK